MVMTRLSVLRGVIKLSGRRWVVKATESATPGDLVSNGWVPNAASLYTAASEGASTGRTSSV